MKKLGKLSINQSKLLENEELVNLRGGYGYQSVGTSYCRAYSDNGDFWLPAIGLSCSNSNEALDVCKDFYEPNFLVVYASCSVYYSNQNG